ncbi:aldose 1-epimerase family protein [Roseomonas marmotae]|uniref:Aldose 1-epimerase family protein n=1 Tax=Roseomonas marmotae TaxID=2768161 RepID=A0ABS3KGK5_9PROT|nr:aldose 1-epimerase family protein [Roseomonas marmotae]MBO1076600.1 aldose 1-epimerase family protein [Roseomonas marmotae]QTI79584.1 aldose 1-epimerase family protein [Roseomonas marmotae]
MSERHSIGAAGIAATIRPEGADLTSLRDAGGEELLWQAGPEWPRHAPVLFPVVGRLAGDTLRHEGREYRMTQHGFARDSLFEWAERTESRAVLRLADSEATRAAYPFPFLLEMIYAAEERTLSVTTRVHNPGRAVLPCGVGAHPAFRWPLAGGVAKEAHFLSFAVQEGGPALAVEGALLGAEKPLPFDGRTLPLSPGLFAQDALVMPGVTSRSLRFIAPGPAGKVARAITVSWEGYKDLGIWSKPGGAPFLCIEPWFSMASPVGWDGEFLHKPGILLLPPGESRDFIWRVTV